MIGNLKIGLALGSGAARGLSHIGVLQVLEEEGIRPDFIAGSSIGAVIGALYACGMKPLMMEGIGRNLDMKSFYDMTIPRAGFIQGKKIEDLIRLLTKDKSFDELELPLAVTAVDLVSCQRVIITEGKVHKAVRASISIPGIFHPVKDNGRVLVDGGVLERIPVNVVREMGADIVIGVDVGFRGEHKPTNNILEIILQSLEVMELELIKHIVPSEDILICPSLNEISPIRFDQVEECVRLGRAATEEAMPRIKALISNLQTRKMDTSP